jgi:hypothetical protein
VIKSTLFLAIQAALADGIPVDQIKDGWRGIYKEASANVSQFSMEQAQDFVDGHLKALGLIHSHG